MNPVLKYTVELLGLLILLIAWNCFHHFFIEPVLGPGWAWLF